MSWVRQHPQGTLLTLSQVFKQVQQFTRKKGSKDTEGVRAPSRGVSGRLSISVEVIPDWGTREVVVSVGLWSERHGEVDVATAQRWLDQLLHPAQLEIEIQRI